MYSLQPKLRSDTPSSQYALYSGECIHAFGKNRTVAHPGPGYCYYELGGMRYQALTGFDIGVHEGYAKAELNNRYDKYAVGVYREGDHKLMGYVRREQNRELYEFMLNNNCIAKAKFRIWIHQGEIYGAAYIKEEWKSSLGFKSDIKI